MEVLEVDGEVVGVELCGMVDLGGGPADGNVEDEMAGGAEDVEVDGFDEAWEAEVVVGVTGFGEEVDGLGFSGGELEETGRRFEVGKGGEVGFG